MNIERVIARVRSQWWVLAVSIFVCLNLALLYLIHAPKIYASRAVLEVGESAHNVVDGSGSEDDDARSAEVLNTIEQSLESQSFILDFIHSEGLDKDPAFAPPQKNGQPYSDSALLARFQSKLSVSLRRGTRLIDVVIEDQNPQRAEELARKFVSAYLARDFQQRTNRIKTARDYLAQEVQTLGNQLDESERQLQVYSEQHSEATLQNKPELTGDRIKESNLQFSEARRTRMSLENDLPKIREAIQTGQYKALLGLNSIASDPEVAALESRIQTEETEFATLQQTYMQRHPKYIDAQTELNHLHEAEKTTLETAAARVVNEYDTAKSTESKLGDALSDQEQELVQNEKNGTYDKLLRETQSDQTLYDALLARMKETTVAEGFDDNLIRIDEEPLVISTPVLPRTRLVLLGALLAGAVLGLSLLLGQDLLNHAVVGTDEIERDIGIPVLAEIPDSKLLTLSSDGILTNLKTFEAESFRHLRTSLQLFENNRPDDLTSLNHLLGGSSCLFTSAFPGEGKSICSFSYALTCARGRVKTLLIDADLRRARLSKALLGREKPGLLELLSNEARFEDVIYKSAHDNLSILPAGVPTPHAHEILAAGQIENLIQEAAAHFDRIIIDSPPVNAVSDALLIAPHVTSCCLVISAGKTPRRAVERTSMLLRKVHSGPIAAVLNRVGPDPYMASQCYSYTRTYADA